MKIETIQTATLYQTVGGKSCQECEEEEAQKKLLERKLVEEDRVTLSGDSPLEKSITASSSDGGLENNSEAGNRAAGNQAVPRTEAELSQEERRVLSALKTRDREVRSHEQAHLTAAGPYAKGPPSFEYQTGPDGKRYAVGGEVQIDASRVPGNPQATLVKAQTVKRAAAAPANPSAQDRRVASQAVRIEAEARREIQEQRTEKQGQAGEPATSTTSADPINLIKETRQTSEPSQIPREESSIPNPSGNFAAGSRIQKTPLSSPVEKGNLLDIVS